MDLRIILTMLVIAFIVAVVTCSAERTPSRPRKRRRTTTNPTPAAPIWPTILKTVKWQTISNMLHWKSEVSQIDNLLGDLQKANEEVTPPSHNPVEPHSPPP